MSWPTLAPSLLTTPPLQHKSIDIITLFHKTTSPASTRLAAALKQASAAAAETSASNGAAGRPEFKLEITESLPTSDQLQTILDYVGPDRTSSIVKGAADAKEALRRFKENGENFQRPVVSIMHGLLIWIPVWLTRCVFVCSQAVDWNNGKAAAGENESEILKMLNALPPK